MSKTGRLTTRVLFTLFLSVVAALTLFPLLVMFLGPFREHLDIINRGAIALPVRWSLDTLIRVFAQFHFGLYLVNTAIVTVPTVLISLVLAVMCAFPLALMNFPLKRFVLVVVTVIAIMISEEFIMIPLFQLIKTLGLVNTFAAAILPQTAMSAAFSTLIIWSFYLGLPREMVDAALQDGASSWQVLWRIYVPISTPAILTAATLTTVWTWNDYIIPLIMLPSTRKATLPLGLTLFVGAHNIDIPMTMAGALVTAAPMLVLFVVFQRHLVKGLTQGVVK
jgi:raffinose/stachyose/melibiose transport system permease protein